MKMLVAALAIACAGFTLFVPEGAAQVINHADDSAQAGGKRTVAKPANLHDWSGWSDYLSSLVAQQTQGIARNHVYRFFVPATDDYLDGSARLRELDFIKHVLSEGIRPGYAVAFGGPSSHVTADFVLAAFKDMPPDSFKGVTLIFLGAQADESRVFARWQACGASVRFADMTARRLPAASPDMLFVMPPPPPPPPGMEQYLSGASDRRPPVYPGFEAVYGISGTTTLQILVSKTGEPLDIKVVDSTGVRNLDAAALNGAVHWHFKPEIKNGIAVDAYVRVPVEFHSEEYTDEPWPEGYLGARMIWDDAPIPYATVWGAMNAVAAQAHKPVYDDHANHAHVYTVYDQDGNMRERWYFMDVASPHAMAVRYSLAGMPGSPQIKVMSLCDNPMVCMNRTSWVMDGPHSLAIARQGGAAD